MADENNFFILSIVQSLDDSIKINGLCSLIYNEKEEFKCGRTARAFTLFSLRVIKSASSHLYCPGLFIIKTELSFDGKFKIDKVIGGTYQLFAYQDRNNNKIIDTGNLQGDNNSEKFYVYPDSLILRTNWELEIEDWNINQ